MKNLLCSLVLLALISPTRGEDWPGFRGPTGQGISAEKGLPTDWSKTKNVAWSKNLPGEAWSSPIVWGDRVYVTTTTDGGASCRILALSRLDGTIAWDVEVCRQKTLRKEGKNSYATPTPVTDGERVYAVYNDGSIAAVTVEGKPSWVNHDVNYYSQHGLGNSPILYRDTLIMAFDGSSDGPEKGVGWQTPWDRAVILALDKKTGKEKWRGKRGQSRIAHTTPIVVTVGGRDELISTAGDVIQGFDPATGERRWSVKGAGEGVVPSPVFGGGLVFAVSGFGDPHLRAVKLTSDGEDKTTRAVAWAEKRNVPMLPSPVFVDPYLFFVTESGTAVCLEAATGKKKWDERLGGKFSASPVYADGHVYFLDEEGTTTVVQAKPVYSLVARNALQEPCQASMAVSQGQLFIRSKDRLYCIGKK